MSKPKFDKYFKLRDINISIISFQWPSKIGWATRFLGIVIWPFDWKLGFYWHFGERALDFGPLRIGWMDDFHNYLYEHPNQDLFK